jgi:hypothetical protein
VCSCCSLPHVCYCRGAQLSQLPTCLLLSGCGVLQPIRLLLLVDPAAPPLALLSLSCRPAVVISFLIAGISALLSALCYSEFAVQYPFAGA